MALAAVGLDAGARKRSAPVGQLELGDRKLPVATADLGIYVEFGHLDETTNSMVDDAERAEVVYGLKASVAGLPRGGPLAIAFMTVARTNGGKPPAWTRSRGSAWMPLMAVGQTVAAFASNLSLAVTRLSDTSVVAVSRTCTHQGCTVLLPGAAGTTLDCPCHGSRFETGGRVVNGPATRPLPDFAARIEGQEVVVTLD